MAKLEKPEVFSYFDETTNAACYILKDPSSNSCAVIDSILDFDLAAGRVTTKHADMLIRDIQTKGLDLEWIIETHVHADHLSAAPYLAQQLGGKIAIGSNIGQGLVKFKSGNIQPNSIISDKNSIGNYMNIRVWG